MFFGIILFSSPPVFPFTQKHYFRFSLELHNFHFNVNNFEGKKGKSISSSKFCHFFFFYMFFFLLPVDFVFFWSIWRSSSRTKATTRQTNTAYKKLKVLFGCWHIRCFFFILNALCCLHEYFIKLLICNMYSDNSRIHTQHTVNAWNA